MIADALVVRNVPVMHLLDDAEEGHTLWAVARVEGQRFVYDVGTPGTLL